MHRHLVAVEVRVERRTDQRMQPDGLAFHQHRIKSLDAETVQRGRAVEQDGMLTNDFIKHVPDFGALLFHQTLGAFDRRRRSPFFQLVEDEGLEQLEGHLFRQAALMQTQFRTDHDDRTT